MRDDPATLDLLRAARETLAQEILPGLEGPRRYTLLMVANALAQVERALVSGERLRKAEFAVAAFGGWPDRDAEAATRALCRAVRNGRHDGDAALHAALHASAIAAVAVTRPDALTATERQQAERKPIDREVRNGP